VRVTRIPVNLGPLRQTGALAGYRTASSSPDFKPFLNNRARKIAISNQKDVPLEEQQ